MRKRKTPRSKRRIKNSGGPANVEIRGLPPLPPWAPKETPKLDKRRDFQNLYDSIMRGAGEEFEAWFEEAAMLEAEIETEEYRNCVADIKRDKQRYRQLIKQLPKVEDFSAEEIEYRTGKASQLLDVTGEIMLMKIHLPRKVERLTFLLKFPSQ